ncbi:MAG: bifunctional tetrahydrofolate synthase/dihydrofolate synthase [Gammaproteobacteria bacterium]
MQDAEGRCNRVRTKGTDPFLLVDWLRWQEHLHPNPIDLGLDRVKHVLRTMHLEHPSYHVLTVGGTNGKGSCVAFLDAILRAEGYKVGAYTSPHLLRYNERICINGVEVTDAELCKVFERIDIARGDVSLTYFEFGTLAAFDIFRNHKIDIALLEVGMGGRLDAVNTVDPDAALVASVSLDHQEWLGNNRDSIGYEKAGIYRGSKPAICGDRDPPLRLLETARQLGADLQVLGRDFNWRMNGATWTWHDKDREISQLPVPSLPGRIQYDNATSVLALLQSVQSLLPVGEEALRKGLQTAQISARFQRVPGEVECVLDVAHNPDAARVLAMNLTEKPAKGRTFAVVGIFGDKAVEDVARALAPQIDQWFVAGLSGPRGQSAAELATRIRSVMPDAMLELSGSVSEAYQAAQSAAMPGDRIVVFGSFQTVSAVLRIRQNTGDN